MASLSHVDELFPPPKEYLPSDAHTTWKYVGAYQISSPYSHPASPPSFSSTLPVSAAPSCSPNPRFVRYETELFRSPALTTCGSCQTQVTTQVTFQVGTYAWVMCLVFVLCGLLLGCCLIPFFVNHFKDAYHTCPRCQQVLHVQRKACCK